MARIAIFRFAIKHAVATGVVIAGIVGVTAASYFALLAWAVLAGEPLGGPLAFPFLVLFALVASVVAAGLILFPATALTEWICVKNKFRLALQIPIATAFVAGYLLLAAVIAAVVRDVSLASAATAAGVVFLLLLVPLGVYWWAMQSADWLLRIAASAWTTAGGSPPKANRHDAAAGSDILE